MKFLPIVEIVQVHGVFDGALVFDAARAQRSDVILLAHGGPFTTPEDTELLYAQTDAQGFLGESSIEHIPIEKGVAKAARDYKAQPLRASAIRG